MRAHGCRLTEKMTGGRPKIILGPSAITLIELSVMALLLEMLIVVPLLPWGLLGG